MSMRSGASVSQLRHEISVPFRAACLDTAGVVEAGVHAIALLYASNISRRRACAPSRMTQRPLTITSFTGL